MATETIRLRTIDDSEVEVYFDEDGDLAIQPPDGGIVYVKRKEAAALELFIRKTLHP